MIRPSLDSPGRATADRAHLEQAMARAIRPALRAFLAEVADDAASPPESVLTASLVDFSVGRVLSRWGRVVSSTLAWVAQGLGIDPSAPDDYLRAVDTRLRNSGVPPALFGQVRSTLRYAAEQNLPVSQIKVMVQDALGDAPVYAKRIARTEATAVYNHIALNSLAAQGYSHKRWVSHHDFMTRPTHLAADGQTRPVVQEFVVGGFALMTPGDPSAPYEETANCRCVIVGA